MIDRVQRLFLLGGRPLQNQGHVRMAIIRRNVDFRHRDNPHPRIGHFISDQFIEFFANALRDALVTVRIQILEYRISPQIDAHGVRRDTVGKHDHIRLAQPADLVR